MTVYECACVFVRVRACTRRFLLQQNGMCERVCVINNGKDPENRAERSERESSYMIFVFKARKKDVKCCERRAAPWCGVVP